MISPLKAARGLASAADGVGVLVSRFPYLLTGSLFPAIGFWAGGWRGLVVGAIVAAAIVGPFYYRAVAMARRHREELRAFHAEADRQTSNLATPRE